MFASRPAVRVSASDGRWGSEPEDVPGSVPDCRFFSKVGGEVMAVGEESVDPWDVTATGTGRPGKSVYVQSMNEK